MADTFLLDLVTPEKTLFSGAVETLVAPGLLGEFGVLPGHANMLTELTQGRLAFKKGPEEKILAAAGGFAEVTGAKVTILLDDAVFLEDLDAATLDSEIGQLESEAPQPEEEQYALWQEKLQWKQLCKEIVAGEK